VPFDAVLIFIVLHVEQYLLFYWETSERASSARNTQMNKEKTG
jgi:NADH:ubiquinone oxidoreductase subunit 3 (subunit A)